MSRRLTVFRAVALLAAPLAATPALAQSPRPISQADFDSWKSITGTALSPDGRWVAYTLTPQVGDGELVVRATGGTTEHRHPRGFTGRPQLQAGAMGGFNPAPARWTADGRVLAFLVYPTMDRSEQARRARTRPQDAPRNALGIFSVPSGQFEVIQRVRSFDLAAESGNFLFYHLEADSAAARPDSAGRPAARPDTGAARPATPARRTPEPGTTLVVRDLRNGQETRIEEVTAFAVDDSAKWLAYTVTSRDSTRDGAFLRSLADGSVTTLLAGRGSHAALTFDRAGQQLAFLSDRADQAADKPRQSLYHATLRAGAVRVQAVATPDSAGAGMIIASGGVAFTRDGSALRFGIGPAPLDSIPADQLAEGAVYDLWHWQDPQLQPQQRLQARQAATRSYAALYRPSARRIVRLGGEDLPQVTLSDDGRLALGTTNQPYQIEAMWGEGGTDVYLIDATTGTRTRIVERLESGGAQLSPGGRFVTFFQNGHWMARDVASGQTRNLTERIAGVRFDQETWDTPSTPGSWGVAGWTAGDQSFVVYDRYDVWELDPAGGRAPRMVTDSAGRRANMRFRIVRTDPDERYLSTSAPLLLSAFDFQTKQDGFYTDRLGATTPPARIVMQDVSFGTPQKARRADMYVVTRSTFRDFPNLWTGARLDQLAKISDANPQQASLRWGTAELVEWNSDDNVPLQGILFKPDDFDPAKKYPMVVYFYEKLSDGLHNFVMTYPRNTIQPTWYVSNGYLVFFPDIEYTTGYPGPDALKSIVPGVQSLIARGFVDPKAIGTAGQSWGGYQTAFMITRTNIFRAAMAGAPVANMTSAYGGIRWGSGLARSFQYEKTQSRIGGSLWEYPLRYLENSPLFHADRIQTPLLMMHNDNDGAVPWYQGIEMFVAMRRLGKEVYMVNYNGDEHNPTKRANQADIAIKTMEFFDHHLRGRPMPAWMAEGIPYLQKGRDQVSRPLVP